VDKEGPGLRDIARTLTTPALSGLPMTKQRIGEIAAGLSLLVALGERSPMLMNVFQSAADLGRISPLLGALEAELDRWESRYVQWSSTYPSSAPIWYEWRQRLASTRALLAEMKAAAGQVGFAR
jgi:hypothetical protein